MIKLTILPGSMRFRVALLITLVVFAGGILIGVANPPFLANALGAELKNLADLGKSLASSPPLLAAGVIFFKNTSSLVISFVFSPLLLLVPVIVLLVNGYVIGLVSVMVTQQLSLGFLLAGILPHGIFEIPAFILGEAAAISLGSMLIRCLFSEEARSKLANVTRQNLRYLLIAVAMLVAAAFIEAFITPAMVKGI